MIQSGAGLTGSGLGSRPACRKKNNGGDNGDSYLVHAVIYKILFYNLSVHYAFLKTNIYNLCYHSDTI
jgi:hypothetical protein